MDKIKQIIILNLKMEGFKRFKEPFEISMDDLTYISGGNGQGKTSVADAIAYVFCGTPVWGEKSSDRLQNSECSEMKVEVRFVDENGEVHTLSRRRSGGNSFVVMDGTQLRQTDMTNFFADKDVFLSVLNPLYFIERLADNGRELLQKLLPSVDQAEILNGLSDGVKALLENEDINNTEYYIQQKRAQLKGLEESKSYLDGQTDLLKTQQKESEEKIDSVLERGQKIAARKEELEKKQFFNIDVNALKQRQTEISQTISDDKRAKLLARRAEIQSQKYESKFAADIAKAKAELQMLSKCYQERLAQLNDLRPGIKCPVCCAAVTAENYNSIVSRMRTELAHLHNKGSEVKAAYQELMEMDDKCESKFLTFRDADLKKVDDELAQLDNDSDVMEIAMLEDKIRLGNLTHAEFEELEDLRKQADSYAKEVEVLGEAAKIPQKISEIEKKIKSNEECAADVQKQINAAGAYAAKKAEITLNKLQMNHAAIKLFDVVKTTGEIKNVFKFTYDGKDYRWLSTSEKIKAGLEVSELLRKLTGLCYPTYIDNAECITTNVTPVHGQVILAFAKNTDLTVQKKGRHSAGQAKAKEAA